MKQKKKMQLGVGFGHWCPNEANEEYHKIYHSHGECAL